MFENFSEMMLELFVSSLWETIIMVGVSGLVGGLIGIPLGVFLRLTDHGGVLQNGPANKIVGWIVNALRSTPFIILLVAIIPLTRLITGSSIGTWAAVVPLTIAAAPFVARLVETALREVDNGLVEAAQSMGATTGQIVWKILLPEALPGIVAGLTISFVSLTGYSAMAGAHWRRRPGRPGHPLRLPALFARRDAGRGHHPDLLRAGHPEPGRLGGAQVEPPLIQRPQWQQRQGAARFSKRGIP